MLQARNEILKLDLKYMYYLMPLAAYTTTVNGGEKLTLDTGQQQQSSQL